MKENEIIDLLRLENPDIGDDCCVFDAEGEYAISVDSVVEGVHFEKGTSEENIAVKAVGAAISDLAAMGAVPVGAVVAISSNDNYDNKTIMQVVSNELKKYGCLLMGGDTTSSDTLVISVTVFGKKDSRLVRRSGGIVDDILVVTGPLGGSFIDGRHLAPKPRIKEGQFFAARECVHAMMDISDGLAIDAKRLSEESGCGCVLFTDRLPIHSSVPDSLDMEKNALCDGEDFELLIAIDANSWPKLCMEWKEFGDKNKSDLCIVGQLVKDKGVFVELENGNLKPLCLEGYEHEL